MDHADVMRVQQLAKKYGFGPVIAALSSEAHRQAAEAKHDYQRAGYRLFGAQLEALIPQRCNNMLNKPRG
jgi:hypothetical protein